jgi:hypothetical protein
MSNNESYDSISSYLEDLKMKRDKATDQTVKVKYDKAIALEEIMLKTYDAPVSYKGKYMDMDSYETCRDWDNGIIRSAFHPSSKTLYIKEEILNTKPQGAVGSIAVHELGHALEKALKDLSPEFGDEYIGKIKQNYNTATNNDKDPSSISSAGTHEFISGYASTSYKEYLAESVCAFFDPKNSQLLKRYDPDQYNTIADLFNDIHIAKKQNQVVAA